MTQATEKELYENIILQELEKWEFTNLKTSLDHQNGIFGYGHVIKVQVPVSNTGECLYLIVGINSVFDVLLDKVYEDKVWIDDYIKCSSKDYKSMLNESFQMISSNASGVFLQTIFKISKLASFTPGCVYWLNITRCRWRALNLFQCIGPYKEKMSTEPLPETIFGVALINLASFEFFDAMKSIDRNALMYFKILKVIARLLSQNDNQLSKFIKVNLTAISATLMITSQAYISADPLSSSNIEHLLTSYRQSHFAESFSNTLFSNQSLQCLYSVSSLHYLLQTVTLKARIIEKLFINEHKKESILSVKKSDEIEAIYRIVSAAIYFCNRIALYHLREFNQYSFALNLVELALYLYGGYFGQLGYSSLLKFNEYCLFESGRSHIIQHLFGTMIITYKGIYKSNIAEKDFYESYSKCQLDFISHYGVLAKLQAADNIPKELFLSSLLQPNNRKPKLKLVSKSILVKLKAIMVEIDVSLKSKKIVAKKKSDYLRSSRILMSSEPLSAIASKIIDPFVYISSPIKLAFIPFNLDEINKACRDINPNSFGKRFDDINDMALEAYLRRVQFEMIKNVESDSSLCQSLLVTSRDIYYEIYNLFKAKFGEKLDESELNLSEEYLCRYKSVCWNLFESNCKLMLLIRKQDSASKASCEVFEKTLKMFKNISTNYPESFEPQFSLYKYSSSLKIEYIMASIDEIISFEGIQEERILENKLKMLNYLIWLNISGSNSIQFEVFCRFKIVSLLSAKLDDSIERHQHFTEVMYNMKRLGIEINNCNCCLHTNFNSYEDTKMITCDFLHQQDYEGFCKVLQNILDKYHQYSPTCSNYEIEGKICLDSNNRSKYFEFEPFKINSYSTSWLVWKEVLNRFDYTKNVLKLWIKGGFRCNY